MRNLLQKLAGLTSPAGSRTPPWLLPGMDKFAANQYPPLPAGPHVLTKGDPGLNEYMTHHYATGTGGHLSGFGRPNLPPRAVDPDTGEMRPLELEGPEGANDFEFKTGPGLSGTFHTPASEPHPTSKIPTEAESDKAFHEYLKDNTNPPPSETPAAGGISDKIKQLLPAIPNRHLALAGGIAGGAAGLGGLGLGAYGLYHMLKGKEQEKRKNKRAEE